MVVYQGCRIGSRVIIHAKAVIGADGFGYAIHAGASVKIPQTGIAVIEDDVEIGPGCTVDRATLVKLLSAKGQSSILRCTLLTIANLGQIAVFQR